MHRRSVTQLPPVCESDSSTESFDSTLKYLLTLLGTRLVEFLPS